MRYARRLCRFAQTRLHSGLIVIASVLPRHPDMASPSGALLTLPKTSSRSPFSHLLSSFTTQKHSSYQTPRNKSINLFSNQTQVDYTSECSHPVVKTFSNLLNSSHHPFAGARCSSAAGASDSPFTR
ncbi:hypothetical protein L207DRAFT_243695 [Hyaloscypha variabilis F]|uniref:Uncharacterized protein n=1 Tax=Hyaloscypha variabilis (strain UAMH 11265 / GT02V1 / F) TaxID=1149755 RepID=A0A2J6S2H8_HYAVF|nr:hypothetical protein L207DRAFT_243695 [Hyaloscypha variabilis F]